LIDSDFTKLFEGEDIARETGLDVIDVGRAFRALHGLYLEVSMTSGGPAHWHIEGVTPAARRIAGQWPSADALVDRLISSLNEAAERESDPVRESRIRQTAGLIGGTVRDIFVEVAAAAITRGTGI
jgi:hypothetical protein